MNVSILILLSFVFLLFGSCALDSDPLEGDWKFSHLEIVKATSGEVLGEEDRGLEAYLRITEDSIINLRPPSFIDIEAKLNKSKEEMWYEDNSEITRHRYEVKNDTLVLKTTGVAGLDTYAYLVRSEIPGELFNLRSKSDLEWSDYSGVWVYSGIFTSVYGADYGLDSLGFEPLDTINLNGSDWYSLNAVLVYGGTNGDLFHFYNDDKGYLSLIPIDRCGCKDIVLQYEQVNE